MMYEVKKVYMGHVSVRDYVIKRCLQNGEDLLIKFGNEYKNFPVSILADNLENSDKRKFISKYDGKMYTLIDLPWNGLD